MNSPSLFRQPSAYLPIVMSAAAILVVLGHVAVYGTAREADEGTAAHLWQLMIAGQLPVVAYFAVTRLLQSPRSALPVLATQAAALLGALAPVYFLDL